MGFIVSSDHYSIGNTQQKIIDKYWPSEKFPADSLLKGYSSETFASAMRLMQVKVIKSHLNKMDLLTWQRAQRTLKWLSLC